MATTLVLDCVGTACSVALLDGKSLLAEHHAELGRGHAEHLVPMISRLPHNGQADRIVVNAGPGSFTGVRIGLSVGRALGLAWAAPVMGFSAINLTAALALAHGITGPLCVVLHGGHGEFFTQNYAANGDAEGPFASLPPADVPAWAKGRALIGNAAEAPALLTMGLVGQSITPRAADFALLSQEQLTDANPHYGRAPDAAIRGVQ